MSPMGGIMLDRSSIVNSHYIPRKISDLRNYVLDPLTEEWEYLDPFKGMHMTVCIAALCEDYQTIVVASDQMISSEFAEREIGLQKLAKIHDKCSILFSASNASPIDDIVRAAHSSMEHHDGTIEDARSRIVK